MRISISTDESICMLGRKCVVTLIDSIRNEFEMGSDRRLLNVISQQFNWNGREISVSRNEKNEATDLKIPVKFWLVSKRTLRLRLNFKEFFRRKPSFSGDFYQTKHQARILGIRGTLFTSENSPRRRIKVVILFLPGRNPAWFRYLRELKSIVSNLIKSSSRNFTFNLFFTRLNASDWIFVWKQRWNISAIKGINFSPILLRCQCF